VKRALLLSLALAAPAAAQDAAFWGGTGCKMVQVAGLAHVAEVRCRNVETTGAAFNEGAMLAGDLVAHVAILHGPGDVPDQFIITPPEGFVAVPPVLVLDEWTEGVAVILPWVGM
jgi:hypothetical protein